MKDSKGCHFFAISETSNATYLCLAMTSSVVVMKWAPNPFNKFMREMDIPIDGPPRCIDILETMPDDVRIVVGIRSSFHFADIQTARVERVQIPGTSETLLGPPVKSVLFDDSVLLCYESEKPFVVLGSHEMRYMHWRTPLKFAGKLGQNFLAAGANSVIDIVHPDSAALVHVFETKREKTKGLQLLSCRANRLFLLAEEVKNGVELFSIISVVLST
ncbi:hypothetical protein DFJ73DRAFT_920396 [Zopfochytrium polystomum]|nr:hypothetical protein DFJ73DRAFT_920396 [Zopfochytrium polystomum]